MVGFVGFIGGFVGDSRWFWVVPRFSNYDSIYRSRIIINLLNVLETPVIHESQD